ncbi:MAG: MFS transporter [Clostridiales bacterium]|nr:MFS transporter [Clostridiales bacterium]
MDQQKSKGFFYGWVIVLAGMLMMGTSIGLFVNCNGVFVEPVTEQLGFGRAAFSLYATIASTLGMLSTVVYGELYTKYPIRRFMLLSTVVCCTSVFGYSISTQLWQFYLFATMYGLCSIPVSAATIAILINRWFRDKKGLATGLAFSGSGLTAAIMNPVVSNIVADMGWRWGYRVLAISGFVLLSLACLLVKESPAAMGLLPYGAEAPKQPGADAKPLELPGLTRKEAVRTPALYLLVLGFFALFIVGMGMMPNVIPYLNEQGYRDIAPRVMSMVMAVMIAGKISLGAAFDKLGAVKSSIVTGLCMVASVVTLAMAGANPYMPYVFAICYGYGYSTLSVPIPYLTAENFGGREYPAIYSLVQMLGGLGGSVGLVLAGLLYDLSGSYTIVWPIFTGLAVCSTVLLTLASLVARKKNYNPTAHR